MFDPKFIRNFSIIAHIDHGKSTLADRLLEITGAVAARDMHAQYLDSMELEREKGITIKSHPVSLRYQHSDGQEYLLNIMDTPGHVDFSYEVNRSLAACEGVVLLVDATQGVEAQTVANTYLALESNLTIIPVINKIDLASAEVERVRRQIEDVLGLPGDEVILISAKEGTGVLALLDAIVARIHPPQADREAPLRALIFNAIYDTYLGVLSYIRVFDGEVRKGDSILFMSTQERYEATELGIFTPARVQVENLAAGEVGYLAGSIKTLAQVPVGDTITHLHAPAQEQLTGYKKVKPMVFCGLYPANAEDFSELTEALEKLRLNDPSFSYVGENSAALGFGYRLGFLGLLHMEVVQERLEREFGLTLVTTTPNVEYRVLLTDGSYVEVDNPSAMPDPGKIELVEEPYIRATIVVAAEHLGAVMKLCQDKRGSYEDLVYLDERRAMIKYLLPLAEIVLDFYDRLKSLSHGYASLDYDYVGHRQSDLVKLDLLINGKIVDALSIVVHKDAAYTRGRALAARLRKLIPRQLFEVVIQAAISSRIIAREVVKPLRKDVIAKCYGGDITRKRKLLDKQREGKKRMKRVGNVDIPQEAFMAVLSVEEK